VIENLGSLPQYLGLNDQVYDILKDAILHHKLPTGYKLDVNELAKHWGVSRTPVNDAIQRLTAEGLVSVVPRRGTFIANMDIKDILELMDVRLMFELRAAELVIDQLTPERLHAMKNLLVEIDKLIKAENIDCIQYSKLDMDFHLLPISWTNNQKLFKIYQAQNFQWYMSRLLKSFAGQEEHWKIFKAYEHGSLEETKQAITSHIMEGKASVEQKILY
jgi:DNA-binding GntR family transcriptional regulator